MSTDLYDPGHPGYGEQGYELGEGDEVWISSDILGVVVNVSKPFRSGNYLGPDRKPTYGREYTIFVPEGDD